MKLEFDIAKVAQLIGDPSRAAILVALMQANALTAGELAMVTNISAQAASNHLKKLMTAKLIICQHAGRHRYYRLASHHVATVLESLAIVTNKKITSPLHKHLDKEICFARTCYDHIAGELGIQIIQSIIKSNMIKQHDNHYEVSQKGLKYFASLNIDCQSLQKQRRIFAKPCLDWTQRNFHLAGSLGKALLDYFFQERLVIKHQSKARVLVLTTKGKIWLKEQLNIKLS